MLLLRCRQRKIQMNAEKYPAEVCRGSSAKYTSYNRGYAFLCMSQSIITPPPPPPPLHMCAANTSSQVWSSPWLYCSTTPDLYPLCRFMCKAPYRPDLHMQPSTVYIGVHSAQPASHESHAYVCRSELAEDQNNKRKRFSDEQLSALTDLADEANWSLLSVAKEVREQFCSKHEISKVLPVRACMFSLQLACINLPTAKASAETLFSLVHSGCVRHADYLAAMHCNISPASYCYLGHLYHVHRPSALECLHYKCSACVRLPCMS